MVHNVVKVSSGFKYILLITGGYHQGLKGETTIFCSLAHLKNATIRYRIKFYIHHKSRSKYQQEILEFATYFRYVMQSVIENKESQKSIATLFIYNIKQRKTISALSIDIQIVSQISLQKGAREVDKIK